MMPAPTPEEMVPPLSATVTMNAEVDWCLRELEKRDTNQVRKDVLASIQNAAIHYACASAKQLKQQAGNVTAEAKANRVISIYKSFAAIGIMEWITGEAGRPLPSWLTPRLMGHSTVTGADEPKLYTSGIALWKRYRKSAAAIRKDFNVIWDEFMDSGKFPPGLGVADAMEDLQQKLYILEQKRTAGRKYYSLVGATETAEGGEHDEGAEGVGAEAASGKGAADNDEPRAKGKGPASKDTAAAAGKEMAEPTEESGARMAEGAGGVPAITEVTPGDEGGEGRRAESGGHPDLDGDDARVYGSRPEGWLHPASLVFAMYGRPSTRQDGDLKMEACGGSLDRKRRAQEAPLGGRAGGSVVDGASSSDTDVNGRTAYPRTLGMGAGGEKPRSRAKARKEVKRHRLAFESLALQREALECLKNPAESEQHAGLLACLQTITEVFVRKQAHDVEAAGFAREAEARAKRAEARALSKQKTDVLYTYLKVLQERGDEEEAQKVAKTLLNHLNTIIAIPIDPPTPAYFPESAALSAPHVLPEISKGEGRAAVNGGGSGEGPCVGNVE